MIRTEYSKQSGSMLSTPAGEVNIEGMAEHVGAASIMFDFVYPIQWMYCKRI